MLEALHVIEKTEHIKKYLEENDPKALEQVQEAIAKASINVSLYDAMDRLLVAGDECRAAQDLVDHAERCEKCLGVHDDRIACPPARTRTPVVRCGPCNKLTTHRDASYVGDREPDALNADQLLYAYCIECSGRTNALLL